MEGVGNGRWGEGGEEGEKDAVQVGEAAMGRGTFKGSFLEGDARIVQWSGLGCQAASTASLLQSPLHSAALLPARDAQCSH